MLPDRVSNPGPLTYESGALPAYTGEEVGELIREKYCTVKKIRRFYGKIPGIWLLVLLPLFLRAFTCRTFLEIKIW